MKILCLEGECYDKQDFECFVQNGYSLEFLENGADQETFEIINQTQKPSIIFTKLGIYISPEHLEQNPNLKIIVTPTTGLTHLHRGLYDRVKIISLKHEIEFLKSITSTAEHAWFLLLDIARNSPSNFINDRKDNVWSREHRTISQISGKSVGIIGLGRLGQILVDYAEAFRMKVLYAEVDSYQVPETYQSLERVPLEDILNRSDYVIVAASYEGGEVLTHPIISSIKNPVQGLINIARGELIDEQALAEAMEKKLINAYRADVLIGDSNWQGDEFKDNVIFNMGQNHYNIKITPHVGGYSEEAIIKTRKHVIEMLSNFLEV